MIERLRIQLEKGTKPFREDVKSEENMQIYTPIPLTIKDKTRINKGLEILIKRC